ncbi:glycosyltransferase family 4 protein [Bradyrhizobium sp. 182]|uniref:glycosyltransferase family 4 protein n=1 Tax=Bradyrhizobium sp. 182 TaxID=2782651 RepID=UPI0031F793A2|nr:glycosyltransferase family 4 protein [Bradyrhizobium sp. 182]
MIMETVEGDFASGHLADGKHSESPGTAARLLFLSHEASRTGAPIFLLNFLRWFRRNRCFDMRILTGRPGVLTEDFARIGMVDSFEPSAAVWYRAMRKLRLQHRYDSNHFAQLRQRYLKEKFDLMYVNSVASARMLEFLSFVECPVVCHVHELAGAIAEIGVRSIARLEERSPVYIAVSHAVKNNLVTNHRISEDRIKVIHGFVPSTQSAIEAEAARKIVCGKLGIRQNANLVCACGSIEFRKGTDIFLQVAGEVVRKYDGAPVHFVWVGGRSDRVEIMQARVANFGLRDVVHFVGLTSDAEMYFKASDMFILTSREDPFPLVVMEAAQQEKPILCFANAGGAPEFVEADAGFVIPGFDVDGMVDKVIELLSSPGLRGRMGLAARNKVLSRYNLNLGAARVAGVIETAIANCSDKDRGLSIRGYAHDSPGVSVR